MRRRDLIKLREQLPLHVQLLREQRDVGYAEDVGADIVLLSSNFARTVSGVVPVLNFQPGQTSTTSNQGMVNANAREWHDQSRCKLIDEPALHVDDIGYSRA